jgi:hypothetical protein
MPAPTWIPGQILASSDVNTWFVGRYAYKSADQSVTSSTTLVNDSALALAIDANATYMFQMYLDYEGGTLGASDFKFSFLLPATATLRYSHINPSTTGVVVCSTNTGAGLTVPGTGGAGALQGVTCLGTLNNGATPGTLQLQWAQATSSGTSTIVHAQSYMVLIRIS